MISTRVGYAGGQNAEPSYKEVGDHAETVEVTFDPCSISYEALLDHYWNSFPHQLPPGPSRVRNLLVPQSESQWQAAKLAKKRLARRVRESVFTDIVSGGLFWPAERMHQKFDLQRMHPDLARDLAGDADLDAFLASPAATRLNAYVTGFADPSVLDDVADAIGWSATDLRDRVRPSVAASDGDGNSDN